MGIKAVFWDFGGVITSSPFEAFRRFEREHGLPEDFLRGVNAVNPDTNAWACFERSEMSLAEFDKAFEEETRAAGYPVSGRKVIELLGGDVRPEMVQALQLIGERYRIACITNNVRAGQGASMHLSAERAAEISEILALFEHVVESSKLGMRKPDPRIYLHTCELMGVAPEQVIYLDDLGINLKPARELGMTTIKVDDPQPALETLGELLDMALLAEV